MDWVTPLAGFGVGLAVGMTGVGGGALMTPLLLLLFGVAPQTAVGTDLLFASLTKVFGAFVHGRRGTIDWQIVRRLACGSLPVALVTLALLSFGGGGKVSDGLIVNAVGIAVVLTSIAMLFKQPLHELGKRLKTRSATEFRRIQLPLTICAGALLGCIVTLTSIGAGALGVVMLVYLYPFRLKAAKLVGTDIAHAIPLATIAGAGHLMLGNIDFRLLGMLLAGSVPGILLGSALSTKAPDGLVRSAIAAILLLVGGNMLVTV